MAASKEKKQKKGVTGLDWCKGWMPNQTEIRIIKANQKARKKGKSYGQYMAGLWEEHERTPINKVIKEPKPKEEKKPRLLVGEEAAEYVRMLKLKAGSIKPENKEEEKIAKSKRDVNGKKIPVSEEKQ